MLDTSNYLTGSSPYDKAYIVKYDDGDVSLEVDPVTITRSTSDVLHPIKDGETLQNIAYRYYGDSGLWYVIAQANGILNPFAELEEHSLLIIPASYG